MGELKDTLVSLQTLITKLLTQVPAPAPTPTPTSSLNKLESAVDKLVSLVSVLANKLEELHNHEEQEQEQDPVEDKLEKLNSSLERLTELIVSISKKLGRSGLVTDKMFGSMLGSQAGAIGGGGAMGPGNMHVIPHVRYKAPRLFQGAMGGWQISTWFACDKG